MIKTNKKKLLITCVLLIILSMSIVSANEENSNNTSLQSNSVTINNINTENSVECNVLVDSEIQKETVKNSISLNNNENIVENVAAGSGETKAIATEEWEKAKNAIQSAANGGTVYLNGTMYKAENGDTQITVSKNITIHGGSENNKNLVSTLDMNNVNRIMLIKQGCVVNIVNVNFLNGYFDRYGAIYGDGARYGGGAICCGYNVKLNITNCNFTDNEAKDGGAIYGEGNVTFNITNCNFINNTVIISSDKSDGGAIYCEDNVKLNITNCNFTDNYAYYRGGAIYCEDNVKLDMNNCDFTNNPRIIPGQSYGGWGGGGAIYLGTYCNLSIHNSKFTNNNGQYGGAIYLCRYSNLSIHNSKFTNNSRIYGTKGGGIYCEDNVKLNMDNCDFINGQHRGSHEGGAIYGKNNVIISMDNCNFTNNDYLGFSDGGAIYLGTYCNLSINNSKFTNNHGDYGGAIYMSANGSLVVFNSEFTNNTTPNYPGQTIYLHNTILVSIVGSKFYVNGVSTRGVLHCDGSNKNVTVSNCEFINNYKYSNGYVIYVNNANCSILNSKFNIKAEPYYSYYTYSICVGGRSILNLSNNDITMDGSKGIPIFVSRNTDVISKTQLTWKNNFTTDYNRLTKINLWLFDDNNNLIEVGGGITVTIENTSIEMEFNKLSKTYPGWYTPDFYGIRLINTTVFSNVTSDVYVIVNKLTSVMHIKAVPGVFNATINVTLNTDGNVTLTIDNRNFTVEVINGVGSVFVPNLKPATYTINGVFEGNEKYYGTTAIGSVTVVKQPSIMNITAVPGIFNATITVNLNTDGMVNLTIDNRNFTVEIKNGTGSIQVPNLKPATYVINGVFEGNEKYYGTTAIGSVTVVKQVPTAELKINTSRADATIKVFTNANGTLNITVDGIPHVVPIKDGVAELTLTNLTEANYTVLVNYPGNDYYYDFNRSGVFEIGGKTLIITAEPVFEFFGDNKCLYIKTTDEKGNPVPYIFVEFEIHGIKYNRTTDNKGLAIKPIDLPVGFYEFDVCFNGNSDYDPITVSSTITINTTILSQSIVKVFENGVPYSASFLDSYGNLLNYSSVSFNIIGIFYYEITNASAGVTLNITLGPGTYIITASNHETGELRSFNVTILPNMIADDLVKYFRNGTQFEIKLLDGDGNAAPIGSKVTLNINGVTYEKTVKDKSGIAVLNITLLPGKYVLTAWYNGLSRSNNVTVLSTIQSEDLDISTNDKKPFIGKILNKDGSPAQCVKATMNIHGVFYNKITGLDGCFKLNINLAPGKYIITTYYGDAARSNTIAVED